MPPDDDIRNDESTFNEIRNDDKALLLRNGYKPGELPADEEQELIKDLRADDNTDDDSQRIGTEADEQDGTDAS